MRCLWVAPRSTPVDQRRSETVFDAALRGPLEQAGVEVRPARKVSSPATTPGTALDEVRACDFVIAEVTRDDPAVYFYLGLAHSLDRPTVTLRLTQSMESTELVRFSDFHTAYELSVEGRAELNLRLREIVTEIRRVTALQLPGDEPIDWGRLDSESLTRLCHELLLLQPGLAWVRRTRDWASAALLARGGAALDGAAGNQTWMVMIGSGLTSPAHVAALSYDIGALEQRLERLPGRSAASAELNLLFVTDPSAPHPIEVEPGRLAELRERLASNPARPPRLNVQVWREGDLAALLERHPFLAARYFSPRSAPAGAEGIVGFYRDAMSILDELLPRQRAASAEEADARAPSMWQNLAYTATHSIGNSLFPVETYLVALQEMPPVQQTEEALEAVEKALENVERAKLQVERFKALSADRKPELRTVDLESHLAAPLSYAQSRGVEVARFGETDASVRCDPVLLDEVLDELVINALTWSRKSPRLSVTVRDAQPADLPPRLARSRERFAWLRFEDNGPGVSRDNKERIFDLFFSTNPQGKGIGLALCRKSIRSFGGEILEAGTPGAGARFEIFLPRADLHAG